MTKPTARDVLADELDGHLPRMAFQMYGQFYNDDPGFDIEAYYQRVAAEMLEALFARGYTLSSQPEAAGDAGLDVERLAEAEYNVDQGNQFNVMADALDWAKEVAAEYDRLAATALPEPGERP